MFTLTRDFTCEFFTHEGKSGLRLTMMNKVEEKEGKKRKEKATRVQRKDGKNNVGISVKSK